MAFIKSKEDLERFVLEKLAKPKKVASPKNTFINNLRKRINPNIKQEF
jgi:hypothetical protein